MARKPRPVPTRSAPARLTPPRTTPAPAVPAPAMEPKATVPLAASVPASARQPFPWRLLPLLLVLALAPVLGGYPTGAAYGTDLTLCLLRGVVLIVPLLFVVRGKGHSEILALTEGQSRWGRIALLSVLATYLLTVVSFLIHSHALTSSVLLFALLPATLDWFCYTLLFMLALAFARHLLHRRQMVYALLAGTVLVSLLSVFQYRAAIVQGTSETRIAGAFFSPNFAAGYLALCLPVLVTLVLMLKNWLALMGGLVAVGLVVGALAATGSRIGVAAGLAGLGVAFLLALWANRGKVAWARVGAVLAVCAVFAWGFRGPLVGRVSNKQATTGGEQSTQYRTYTWRGALKMAVANPVLGTGPGTFATRYPPYALVAKTDLAHESYLQLAAEQGFPVLLCSLVALGAMITAGITSLNKSRAATNTPDDTDAPDDRLLLCGLVGGLVAGMIRSLSDSEWSIVGNAFPFWAVAGLVAGWHGPVPHTGEGNARTEPRQRLPAWVTVGSVSLALIGVLTLAQTAYQRDVVAVSGQGRGDAVPAHWPPDPELLYRYNDRERAAQIEPSGKRFYQLAQWYAAQNRNAEARTAFQQSLAADPNSLQSWRAYAEFEEGQRNTGEAIRAWRELIGRHEGPVGKVRAISEIPDTNPAYAYAALGEDDERNDNYAGAIRQYEQAAEIVEAYSQTPNEYQMSEVAQAQIQGSPLAERRQRLTALFDHVTAQLHLLLTRQNNLDRAREWDKRMQETKDRLAKMLLPDSAATGRT